MTREEIKDFCNMKAQLEPENEDVFNAIIKALEQETVSKESYDHEYFLRKELEMKIAKLEHDKNKALDKIRAEITNHLQIMDICDVKKVNGVIVQSELVNRKVVLYDSVIQIIDKYKAESET